MFACYNEQCNMFSPTTGHKPERRRDRLTEGRRQRQSDKFRQEGEIIGKEMIKQGKKVQGEGGDNFSSVQQ